MPRHPSKTTLIIGASSIGKTHALREAAESMPGQITLLSTAGEPGFQPFSIEAVRNATTPYLAIDEIADVGHFNPEVLTEALDVMEEVGAVKHLILVAWSDRAAKDEGFNFPRGTKTLSMRERRMHLVLDGDSFRFVQAPAQAA